MKSINSTFLISIQIHFNFSSHGIRKIIYGGATKYIQKKNEKFFTDFVPNI
tara:strand:- start:746 stop:898 length:153 start_codon:yes stop_codon:yes gene_type:complete